jgi:hypothetical protein
MTGGTIAGLSMIRFAGHPPQESSPGVHLITHDCREYVAAL